MVQGVPTLHIFSAATTASHDERMMDNRKELLAYCGLYCGDCPAYTGEIPDAANNLADVLEKYRIDRVAEILFPEELGDYDKLQKMLEFLGNARCTEICRQRPDTETSCKIRKCCKEKGFFACHECDDFEDCDHIKTFMQGFHAEACVKNLRTIKEMGVEAWIENGDHMWFV